MIIIVVCSSLSGAIGMLFCAVAQMLANVRLAALALFAMQCSCYTWRRVCCRSRDPVLRELDLMTAEVNKKSESTTASSPSHEHTIALPTFSPSALIDGVLCQFFLFVTRWHCRAFVAGNWRHCLCEAGMRVFGARALQNTPRFPVPGMPESMLSTCHNVLMNVALPLQRIDTTDGFTLHCSLDSV